MNIDFFCTIKENKRHRLQTIQYNKYRGKYIFLGEMNKKHTKVLNKDLYMIRYSNRTLIMKLKFFFYDL